MARWRETTLAASDRKEATRSLYATLSRKHIEAGVIGPVPLAKLRPSDVEKLILSLRAPPKACVGLHHPQRLHRAAPGPGRRRP